MPVKKGLSSNIDDKDGLLNIIKAGASAGGVRA